VGDGWLASGGRRPAAARNHAPHSARDTAAFGAGIPTTLGALDDGAGGEVEIIYACERNDQQRRTQRASLAEGISAVPNTPIRIVTRDGVGADVGEGTLTWQRRPA
jgi:hypothetical protein